MARARFRGWGLALSTVAVALVGACGDINVDDPRAGLPTVSLERPPPAIAGGTLTVVRDGTIAVAADPDHAAVHFVTLATGAVRTVQLAAGEEPGRVVEDGDGLVHVLLRREGAVLSLDPERAELRTQRKVCPSPRGIAFARGEASLYVACAYGELVRLPAAGGPETLRSTLLPDLRDVLVHNGRVRVSRFRNAELLELGGDGAMMQLQRPPLATLSSLDSQQLQQRYEPSVAWRTVALDDGRAVMVHQRGLFGPEAEPPPNQDYSYSRRNPTWRDPCGNSVVHSTITVFAADGTQAPGVGRSIAHGVLPVDVAVSRDGKVAVAFAAEMSVNFVEGPQVIEVPLAEVAQTGAGRCINRDDSPRYPGQAVAVAYAGERLVVQLRQPSQLHYDGRSVLLSAAPSRDTGHDIFHINAGGGIACASCHPEGGDDGRVWEFRATGRRRTQTLENGVVALPVLHWAGDISNARVLMDTTLTRRMTGPSLAVPQVDAVERWMRSIPAVPAPVDQPMRSLPAEVQRGHAVFHSEASGCVSCHSGELMSDGRVVNVATGTRTERWRVAPLRGLGLRAPFMHDGCGATLREAMEGRGHCARPHAGFLALPMDDRAAVLSYLQTL